MAMQEDIVRQIHSLLLKKGLTLAIAESCTGGLLAKLLTDLSGSSKYFILGVIPYSNKAKIEILKIPAGLIARKGAVSGEVAQRMAEQIRQLAKTDLGIAITGIAGPSGQTPKNPIGTVFIAINSKNKKICKKFQFSDSRTAIRKKSAYRTMELLKSIL